MYHYVTFVLVDSSAHAYAYGLMRLYYFVLVEAVILMPCRSCGVQIHGRANGGVGGAPHVVDLCAC